MSAADIEFEKIDVVDVVVDEHSILKGVSFEYITQHYQNMVMHRYPSELCDLFKHVFPQGKRHSDKARIEEGNGATLFYHYLMHGFRNYDVRVLDVVESEAHVHPTRLVWNTYLQDIHSTQVKTYADFLASNGDIPAQSLDVAIFNMYNPKNSEMNTVENVFRIFSNAIHLLKPSGFMFLEGLSLESVHYITATISSLYLYPKMCQPFMFSPLGSTRTSYAIVGIRRNFEGDYNVFAPGMYPLIPIPRGVKSSPYKTFVLVTSAMKSIGNSNIFSEDTRFRQLLHSVRTIHQHIPNAHVCVSELSELSPEYLALLGENGVDELQTFKSLEGVPKSFCEALVLRKVFKEVIETRPGFDSLIKLSGRYFLTDDFPTYDPTQIICKRMRPQEVMTRFFSIPKSLFGRFVDVLDIVANRPEVQAKEMDIEHAIGQACPEMDEAAATRRRLGVAGFYATNGQMLVE
jgi:hypothetical protein